MENFSQTALREEVKRAVAQLGFEKPTPVQAVTLPLILDSDRDLIALARTGTGKTGAFGLPVVNSIDPDNDAVQALILCPTRELCLQITRDLESFARFLPEVKVTAVYGGASAGDQIRAIRSGAKVIVGTPGRTLDLINRGKLKVDQLSTLVLDEADEMLNMGFQEELSAILAATPSEKQTLLFSATMPKEARRMSEEYMKNPEEVSIDHTEAGKSNIEHKYFKVKGSDRFRLLQLLIELDPDMYAVIFCRTRREVAGVSEDLRFAGHAADGLHGDMGQEARDDVMRRFRKGRVRLLVATDVAARGLDVDDLTHVINYNLPDSPEVYVHRSGRTGRAGKAGTALSIITGREMRKIRDIERYAKLEFSEAEIPTREEIYRRRALAFAERIRETEPDDVRLAAFMPEVTEALEHLDREELVHRFMAHALADLSRQMQGKGIRKPKEEKESRGRRDDVQWTRLCMSAGRRQGYTVPQVIGMLNRNLPGKKIDLGKIDLQNNLTFIDVDAREAKRVVSAFKGVVDKGNELNMTVYDDDVPGFKSEKSKGGGFKGKKGKKFKPGNFKKKRW